jgi:hypothetical protein
MEDPQLRGRAARQLFLTYTLVRLFTRSRANILYDQISQIYIFCTTLDRLNTFFSLYEFNYLHRNLTVKQADWFLSLRDEGPSGHHAEN